MPGDQDEVPAGAVIAAMELVKGLGDNENAMCGMHVMLLLSAVMRARSSAAAAGTTSPRALVVQVMS